ncbi:MAG: hypothetical protein AB7V42_01090 [Thermoleophilia bacterium]
MEYGPCGRCPLPAHLREGIRRGWRGLAIGASSPGEPVSVVCAVAADRIPALAERGLAVGLPARPPSSPRGPRRVALALVSDRSVGLTLDLAFADARAIVARIGAEGRVRLVWARQEDGTPVRADLVGLSPQTAERLRHEAARQGEWRVEDPHPAGFSRRRWMLEAAQPPPPRLARGDISGAPVVVVAPVDTAGTAPEAADAPGDIELEFPLGPPIPEAGSAIRLRFDDPRQRELARDLADQERVAVLLVDGMGGWIAHVDVTLGASRRGIIAAAARGRARP